MTTLSINENSAELVDLLASTNTSDSLTTVKTIHVSELTSLPAFAYEKIRNIVDYKEENLLRKNAISRLLKRKFILPQFNQPSAAVAQAIIRELILSRYLANDSVPESVIAQLSVVLDKYFALFDAIRHRGCEIPRWREQILGLAAVECDSYIVSTQERHAYTAFATRLIRPSLDLTLLDQSADRQNIQITLTIERVLNRADRDILNYYLLRHYYPDWFQLEGQAAGTYLAPLVTKLLQEFSAISSDPLGKRLLTIIKRLLVPVMIFRQACRSYPGRVNDLLRNFQTLEQQIRTTYRAYWRDTRRRIRRKGFHAMAYIFITKILLAILLELPYEKFVVGHISYLPLGINLLFPPLLMMVITLLIKSPGAQNEERIVQGVKEMITDTEADFFATHQLTAKTTKFWAKLFYGLLYILTMTASFSALVFLLWRLGFNTLSGALFIFFVSLVSFFGISLRQQARQLKVVSRRETITTFLLDFFAVPIVALGKWLSNTFDRYNFLVFVMDFLFEVPFKTILKIIEDWFHFLKEKKEEMM